MAKVIKFNYVRWSESRCSHFDADEERPPPTRSRALKAFACLMPLDIKSELGIIKFVLFMYTIEIERRHAMWSVDECEKINWKTSVTYQFRKATVSKALHRV